MRLALHAFGLTLDLELGRTHDQLPAPEHAPDYSSHLGGDFLLGPTPLYAQDHDATAPPFGFAGRHEGRRQTR